MPTYDYVCDACGHEFEQFQSITAAVLRKCPQCSKRKLRRLIGAGAGVIFKGNGFYQTDYRSDSYRQSAEKDKPPSSTGSDKSDKPAKSETKSETKSESKPASD
ncbi:MAG TPA: zinc ribbon domain-containing protein [Phycisphaerae bacterium]|nr:zinc ribbon domain-containing protein [Phycisphaerae bacterium]HUU21526.1 zinc ribbon domain-containing protein [Phycisphaerae bacterium]